MMGEKIPDNKTPEELEAEIDALGARLGNKANDVVEDEKAKREEKKKTIGQKLKKYLKPVIAVAAIAITASTLLMGCGEKVTKNVESTATEDNDETKSEKQETIGIKEGYGEKGMWLSENKGGPVDFGSAKEVAEACDYDEVEMVKYTADNQVEAMSDYLANMPEALQPEGFKGLSILETEKKIESLSDDEYEALQKDFNAIMDKAFTRRVQLDGEYDNALMRKKDANGETVHENMELVKCTTHESGIATQFYWLDENGNEIGSMTVKIRDTDKVVDSYYDENGNQVMIYEKEGCLQVVTKAGDTTTTIYADMPEIPEEESKWGKEGDDANAGNGQVINIDEKVDPDSEVSEEENDQTNEDNPENYWYQAPGDESPTEGTDGGFAGVIVDEGSTDEGRLDGGENQGGDDINGENPYAEGNEEGEEVDDEGNEQQEEAHSGGVEAGEDNYTDEEEEKAIADGDF